MIFFFPFTDCISEINNTEVDNPKDIDVAMSMYNLIKYSNNYSKTSGGLCQYYRDEPITNDAAVIVDVINNGDGNLLNFKQNLTDHMSTGSTKDDEIMVPLKHLRHFWKTLEMPLTNCDSNFILTWSANCVIAPCIAANQAKTFAITDRKLCVSFGTLPADIMQSYYNN